MKSFGEQHDYDGLVVLLSIATEQRPSDQQVAVFSNDTDLLNQVPIEIKRTHVSTHRKEYILGAFP